VRVYRRGMGGADRDRVAFETARLELARLRVTMAGHEVALQGALRLCARTLKVDRVGFWRFADDRQALALALGYTLSTDEWNAGDVLLASRYPAYWVAIESRRIVAAHDAPRDPATHELADSYLAPLGIGALLDAPVFRAGELIGVVCFEHVGAARSWSPDELSFASATGDLVAMVLEQGARLDAEAALRVAAGRAAAAEKLELVERLARGVAHDFANVLLAVELVAARVARDGDADAAASLRACAEIGGNLVGQLRRFGDRGNRGAAAPLRTVVEHMLPILVTLLRDAASIEVDLDALPADVTVAMPAGHVEQLVLNLCLNAKDALPGHGAIRLAARTADGAVVLTVADDGAGMPPEVIARIWEPYFTTKATGTGLGLATVKAIVDEAGATISVASSPGRGTTFTVTIPIA
jgi:signal transduction histidine kinase